MSRRVELARRGSAGIAELRFTRGDVREGSRDGGGAVLLGEVEQGWARAGRGKVRRKRQARRGPRAGHAVRRRWFVADERACPLGVARGAAEEAKARRRSVRAARMEAGRRWLVADGSKRKERGRGSAEWERERKRD